MNYELRLLVFGHNGDSIKRIAEIRIAGGSWDYVNTLLLDAEQRITDIGHPIERAFYFTKILNNEYSVISSEFSICV